MAKKKFWGNFCENNFTSRTEEICAESGCKLWVPEAIEKKDCGVHFPKRFRGPLIVLSLKGGVGM